jgi:hypothetical protein
MLFNFAVSAFIKWFICAKKLPDQVLCNLQFFDMLKKQYFEKKITRRIMQSAIWLSVLDFS